MKAVLIAGVLAASLVTSSMIHAQGRGRGQAPSPGAQPDRPAQARDEVGGMPDGPGRGAEKGEQGLQERERMGKQAGERMKAKPETAGGPAIGAEKRAAAHQRVLQKAEEIHLRRLAQLQVVHERLQEKGNETAAARAQELMEREKERYEQHVQRLRSAGPDEHEPE